MADNQALEALKTKYLDKALVEALTEPTPEGLIKYRGKRGGGKVGYVPSPHFIRKLNDCFGFLWSYEVGEAIKEGDQIVARGTLTVHIPLLKKRVTKRYSEKTRDVEEESSEFEILSVRKEQYGSSEVKRYARTEWAKDKRGNQLKDDKGSVIIKHRAGDVIDLGDDYKAAGTDAMKKCSTQFGIFLDVYESMGSEEGGKEGQLTKEQLEAFYWRADEAGMDVEKANLWAGEQLGKPIGECDSLDIMGLIPPLIDLAEKIKKEVV